MDFHPVTGRAHRTSSSNAIIQVCSAGECPSVVSEKGMFAYAGMTALVTVYRKCLGERTYTRCNPDAPRLNALRLSEALTPCDCSLQHNQKSMVGDRVEPKRLDTVAAQVNLVPNHFP
jgi:hypothetical protein